MKKQTNRAEETMQWAAEMFKNHPENKLFLLYGDLASGKTTFVKGVASYFNEDPKNVKSPTFAFRNEHEHFIHYDLYRLESADPLLLEQIQDDLQSKKPVFIEWPERLEQELPKNHLKIHFEHNGKDLRKITLG